MKVKKTKDQQAFELVNVLITKCEKKPENKIDVSNSINNLTKNVSDLTNTEDIKDDYAYTKECMRRFSKIIPPTAEELQKIYIESFPFDEELKSNLIKLL